MNRRNPVAHARDAARSQKDEYKRRALKAESRLAAVRELVGKWRTTEKHHELSYGVPYCLHCIGENHADELEAALEGDDA